MVWGTAVVAGWVAFEMTLTQRHGLGISMGVLV